MRDHAGADLRLVDRWHRLRFSAEMIFYPGELRRVHRGHVHDGNLDIAFVVQQFTTQRVREANDGMFGGAIGGLEGDAAICKRGADLDDASPVAWKHTLQRGESSMNITEIIDLCN